MAETRQPILTEAPQWVGIIQSILGFQDASGVCVYLFIYLKYPQGHWHYRGEWGLVAVVHFAAQSEQYRLFMAVLNKWSGTIVAIDAGRWFQSTEVFGMNDSWNALVLHFRMSTLYI